MVETIVGPRIRERRRQLGITQAELARRVGISASYLNLIERNKRRIAGRLLLNTAEALDIGLDELDAASERRLAETLSEIAHLPALRALDITADSAGELIGSYPAWARALAALARAEREATARARALSDRLSNDPFLGESVHRMLTRISAIRSAAEILTEYPDLADDRRERFHRIVHEESRALSDVGEALAAYFDKAEDTERALTPLDEVEALFDARENRFAEIEAAADALPGLTGDARPIPRRERAQALVEAHLTGLIDEVIGLQPQIETEAARGRARRALAAYAAGAILMPMADLEDRAGELGYDVEALAQAFGAEIGMVCQRLTALPRGDDRPSFGYLRANAAGTIISMLGLRGLAVPRYAAACPLWVLYRAQQSPEAIIRQRALFPTGARFIFVAHAHHTGATGFGKARHYVTDMLTMTESDSHHTIYAPDPAVAVEEVGPSCRLCPRRDCAHRVEDPLTE